MDEEKAQETVETGVSDSQNCADDDLKREGAVLPEPADEETQESMPFSDAETSAQDRGVSPKEHHETIYEILMRQDEITWKSIILELIKSEQMDPWDINLSLLSKMFINTLKKLKEMNLRLSGKVLLSAALLLRIKSCRLVGDDLMEFDRLLASGENVDELYEDSEFVEGEFNKMGVTMGGKDVRLIPKTPQPRQRKVSVYDLIDALALALKVKRRRILNQIQTTTMDMPEKKEDISALMDDLFETVSKFIVEQNAEKIAFSHLVPGDSKTDKIHTFVPLLHLTNARKIDLDQKTHFGEIWVKLAKKDKQRRLSEKDDENQ